jgi:hypothetical protein
LFLGGLGVQAATVVFLTLTQLYVVVHLQIPAAEFAKGVLGLRYALIAVGVLLASPLGTRYGTAWLLRRALVATASCLLLMALGTYDAVRWGAALGSASSSVGMVAVNALLQTAARGDGGLRARLNANYRLLAACAGIVLPMLTTHVLQAALPEYGYQLAFVLVAMLCLASAAMLGAFADQLLPGKLALEQARRERAAEEREEGGTAMANGSGAHAAGARNPEPAASAEGLAASAEGLAAMLLGPFVAVARNRQALLTLVQLLALQVPTQVFGSFKGSLLRQLGATQSFQGMHASVASALALGSILLTQRMVQRMPARRAYQVASLVNAVCFIGMGLLANLWPVALAALGSTFCTKSMPITHSMWVSEGVPPGLLTATFATEKVVSCALRAVWSTGLGELSRVVSIEALFIATGVLLFVIALLQLWGEGGGAVKAAFGSWIVSDAGEAREPREQGANGKAKAE